MFTAVLPPLGVVEEIDERLVPRREAAPDLRWRRPDGWHLTTAFMESVPDAHYERLVEELTSVAERTAPFVVRVAQGLAFPHAAKAKILALAAHGAEGGLDALSRRCRSAANNAGVGVDGATFVGHLTLARHNRGIDASRWLTILDSFPGWSWTADELVLIESHQVGRQYEIVERFPLR